MSEKLLPCPFCGSTDLIDRDFHYEDDGYYEIGCKSCNGAREVFCGVHAEDRPEAVRQWNTRAPQSPAPAPEARAPADPDLIERCKELIEWGKTGLLHGGEGGAMRKLADTWEPKVGEHHALRVAEKETHDEAMKALVSLAASPTRTAAMIESLPDAVPRNAYEQMNDAWIAVNDENAMLRTALQNMMGFYDTPISRRRYPPDEMMLEALRGGREALEATPDPSTAMTAEPVAWRMRLVAGSEAPGGWSYRDYDPTPYHRRYEYQPLYATPPSSGNADAVREALTDAETWCDMQAHAIGNVDGYDYRSGEEAAYRHCAVEMKKRAALADPRNNRVTPEGR